MSEMTSSRPYMLRALYEWILDNQATPHILVNAQWPNTEVPRAYVNDGQIVLNLAPSAIRNLFMDNQWVTFDGRFGGQAHALRIPVEAVMAIYARENGQGMVFDLEPAQPEQLADAEAEPVDDNGPDDDGPSGGGRPRLRVVK
ncbi:stringent starvation protein B [Atopomonas hussainii]|uniref:Stringent starvation protein B n=2 Tax=Atopomonas hussainii TaxID=1429083 RepID=A0A1H7LNG9_9GAMM|nr:stringent starvation protein B [Atopomonas hussainii]